MGMLPCMPSRPAAKGRTVSSIKRPVQLSTVSTTGKAIYNPCICQPTKLKVPCLRGSGEWLRLPLQFIQGDADLKQCLATLRIAGVHGGFIGGFQRIDKHSYFDATLSHGRKR